MALFLFDFTLTQLSFTDELLVAAVAAFIGTVAFVYVGVRSFNEEAKEKGETEKGYTLGSVIADALIGFVMLFFMIYYELFLEGPLLAQSSCTAPVPPSKAGKGQLTSTESPVGKNKLPIELFYAQLLPLHSLK